MSMDHFILDDTGANPIVEPDLIKWARWFESRMSPRIVQRTRVGNAEVSTVFLGVDHQFGRGEPILWETMIFGHKGDEYQTRCGGTREDAMKMHEQAIKHLKVNP